MFDRTSASSSDHDEVTEMLHLLLHLPHFLLQRLRLLVHPLLLGHLHQRADDEPREREPEDYPSPLLPPPDDRDYKYDRETNGCVPDSSVLLLVLVHGAPYRSVLACDGPNA